MAAPWKSLFRGIVPAFHGKCIVVRELSYVFGLTWKPDSERMTEQWLLSKYTDWQYEKEWRFAWIAPPGTFGDFGDFEFQRAALVELVTGCRTDEARAAELRSLAHAFRPDVRYSRMSSDPSGFRLDRELTRPPSSPPSPDRSAS